MGRWMTAASELQELRLNNMSLHVKECVVTLPSLQVLSLDSKFPATMNWAKEVRKAKKPACRPPLGGGLGTGACD